MSQNIFEMEVISKMSSHSSSEGLQWLKPSFIGSLNVAAKAATHKDPSEARASRQAKTGGIVIGQ
jgi:hypothetical protein